MFSLWSYRKGNQKISLEQKQNIATFLMNVLSEKQHVSQKKISKPVLYDFGFFQTKSISHYEGLVCLHLLKEEVQMIWKYCHSQESVKFCMRPQPLVPRVSQKNAQSGSSFSSAVSKNQLSLTVLQLVEPMCQRR